MGPSGWSYFVPYQSNIQQAFQDLQNWVLQNDDYFLLETREEAIERIEKELAKPLELQFGFKSHQDVEILNQLRDDAISKLNILKSKSKPRTNQEKLQEIQIINGDWGTHSILDMYQVTQQPDFASVSPLLPEQLMQFYGTEYTVK